jgi:hypothetical protein
LYNKSGGAAYVAKSTADSNSQQAITIERIGQNYKYSFHSWYTPYNGPAQWQKTEFDYRLEITLCVIDKASNKEKYFAFQIDTRSEEGNITDEVLPLEIMYGCMAPDTEIRMSDGKTKQICNIHICDIVRGKDGENMQVTNIWTGPEMDNMIKLTAEGVENPVVLTKSHPVWIDNGNRKMVWKRAGECCKGDRVFVCDAQGKEFLSRITDIEEVKPCERVYNLDLMPCNGQSKSFGTMYCNGILTGDNQIQNSSWEE